MTRLKNRLNGVHSVFSCALTNAGVESKADAIKSRNRATEKNMKGSTRGWRKVRDLRR